VIKTGVIASTLQRQDWITRGTRIDLALPSLYFCGPDSVISRSARNTLL
jgi:hypothetical protein